MIFFFPIGLTDYDLLTLVEEISVLCAPASRQTVSLITKEKLLGPQFLPQYSKNYILAAVVETWPAVGWGTTCISTPEQGQLSTHNHSIS